MTTIALWPQQGAVDCGIICLEVVREFLSVEAEVEGEESEEKRKEEEIPSKLFSRLKKLDFKGLEE